MLLSMLKFPDLNLKHTSPHRFALSVVQILEPAVAQYMHASVELALKVLPLEVRVVCLLF